MKNILIAFAMGLFTAIILQSFTRPHTPILKANEPPVVVESHLKLQRAKEKLQNLFDIDIQEYHQLKTMEAKYRKANDILAQIMTIFLADLGLRVSHADIEKISTSEVDTGSPPASNEACPKPTKVRQCPSLTEMATQAGQKLSPLSAGSKRPREWVQKETLLSEVKSDQDEQEFLKDVEIPDFFFEVANAKEAGLETYQSFRGIFEGRLEYSEPEKNPPAQVYLELDAQFEDGKIVGQKIMKLSRNGEVFSNSTGNGHITDFKKPQGSGQAIFVDLGGKSGFFQLYFVNGGNTLIGNYYRQTSVSKFRIAGTARLQRRP